jgi:excisionase family DNA binding protein
VSEERESPWYTRDEASAYLRISARTLDEWVTAGRVQRRAVKGSRSVRYHRDDLDRAIVPPASGVVYVHGTDHG